VTKGVDRGIRREFYKRRVMDAVIVAIACIVTVPDTFGPSLFLLVMLATFSVLGERRLEKQEPK
jgi:hypothetical protein